MKMLPRIVMAMLVVLLAVAVVPHVAHGHTLLLLAMPMMVAPPQGFGALAQATTPQSGTVTDQVPYLYFDTATLTAAGPNAQSYSFFTGANAANPYLTNFQGAGALSSPNYFSIYSFGFDILIKPDLIAAAATGLADIDQFIRAQLAQWLFTMSDKNVGPFPLRAAHASGGITGQYASSGTSAATAVTGYVNNGIFDGGFVIDNAIVIPPQTQFQHVVKFLAAPTITSGANVYLVAWMYGTLYRKVV